MNKAEILAVNDRFEGVIRVQDGLIQFCAQGRKNWYHITEVRRGSLWRLSFGRYGQFVIRQRQVLTLDETLNGLFARARKLRERERAA